MTYEKAESAESASTPIANGGWKYHHEIDAASVDRNSDHGVLTDYITGEEIRTATAEEHERSLAAGETGAFDLDGRTVFVAGGTESTRTEVDIDAIHVQPGDIVTLVGGSTPEPLTVDLVTTHDGVPMFSAVEDPHLYHTVTVVTLTRDGVTYAREPWSPFDDVMAEPKPFRRQG